MATRPTRPCAEKPAIIVCTLLIIDMSGQNGMFWPENKTSKTIPRASSDTPTSVNWLAHPFMFFKISMIPPILLANGQHNI